MVPRGRTFVNMNILLLAPQPFFQNRGTPIAVKLVLESLSIQGHRIKVLTYPEGENVELANCEILRLPAVPGLKNVKPGLSWKKIVYDLLMFFKARKLACQCRFDLVHAVEESAFIAKNIRKSFGIPYVYDMDSSLSQQVVEKYGFLSILLPILEQIEKTAIKSSIGVIPVCKSIEDTVLKHDPNKLVQRLEDISLLACGDVDVSEEGKRINTDGPVVMYVGNLEKYQGIDLLLDSFQIVSQTVKDANLAIIGGTERDINFYKNLSAKLKIDEKILFMGPRPVSDLRLYLEQANILVSPRIKGYNTPMKIYSYLDSGKAILATRLLTHTQVLDDGIAYLVEPNVQSMASGMVELLRNETLRNQLADQAKQRVQQEYTFEAYQRKLCGFYAILEEKIAKADLRHQMAEN